MHRELAFNFVFSAAGWWAGMATWYDDYTSVSLVLGGAIFGAFTTYLPWLFSDEREPTPDSAAVTHPNALMFGAMLVLVVFIVGAGMLANRADIKPESLERFGAIAAAAALCLALLWAWERLRPRPSSRRR